MSSKTLRLSSPLKVEEEIEKQGIVSILGSEPGRPKFGSLRRTLSADMSSKKWLAQNGIIPMKKIASSEEFPILTEDSCSSSEDEVEECGSKNCPEQDDVWRSIQLQKEKKELEKPVQSDIWSSIVSQKPDDSSTVPPPYVHPLVKRSTSALSEKSLEICTESLGSETGSDGFSSYPSSETGDTEDEKEAQKSSFNNEEFQVVKYNYASGKKVPPRSFPPPLASLASGGGASLHVQSRRENGRLVLEAVSVPPRNYFNAHRQDGRLLLTFANSVVSSEEPSHEDLVDDQEGNGEFEEVFQDEIEYEAEEEEGDEDDMEEEEDGEEEMIEEEKGDIESGAKLASGGINVHRSALMIKKLMGMENRNPTWTKFNKSVKLVETEEDELAAAPLPHSLPPLARLIPNQPAATTAAASFNAYEYFWRAKPVGTMTVMNLIAPKCLPLKNGCNKAILRNGTTSPKAYEKQEMVLLRGNNKDYLGKGCKEQRRSLLSLEPYCIATS